MNLKRLMEPKMLPWLAAALLVAVLLLMGGGDKGMASQEEQRIAEVLGAMAGAGKVEVALFYGGETDALGARTTGPTGAVVVAEGADDLVGSAVADPSGANAPGPARKRRRCICNGGGRPMNAKKASPEGRTKKRTFPMAAPGPAGVLIAAAAVLAWLRLPAPCAIGCAGARCQPVCRADTRACRHAGTHRAGGRLRQGRSRPYRAFGQRCGG